MAYDVNRVTKQYVISREPHASDGRRAETYELREP